MHEERKRDLAKAAALIGEAQQTKKQAEEQLAQAMRESEEVRLKYIAHGPDAGSDTQFAKDMMARLGVTDIMAIPQTAQVTLQQMHAL